MKWSSVCILNLAPEDSVITRSATLWKQRYSVPDNRCFALGTVPAGFVNASTGCLKPPVCTLSTKLMIFAHGDAILVKVWSPFELADVLCNFLGLCEAGLIAFKACEIGKGQYLDNFARYMNARSARIGWLIGYKHDTVSFPGSAGVVREVVQDDNFEDMSLFQSGYKPPDDMRVKVVKGNVDVVPPLGQSHRYSL
jgi:hypothetical protein